MTDMTKAVRARYTLESSRRRSGWLNRARVSRQERGRWVWSNSDLARKLLCLPKTAESPELAKFEG